MRARLPRGEVSMTEAEWLASEDPVAMLRWATDETPSHPPGWHRPSVRKLRLFACACVRRVWPMLTDERSRHAVEVAELYADGLAGEAERDVTEYAADDHAFRE